MPNDGTTANPGSAGNQDSFIAALQDKLMGQSNIISSENTNIEDKINSAIGTLTAGNNASSAAVTSQFNTKEADAQNAGNNIFTSTQEASRGYAMNTAALTQIKTNTAKSVADLENQKQQLILSGDATTAKSISDLQVQALQFEQDAQEKVFNNILSTANLSLNVQKQQQDQQQISDQEKGAISDIALKYGVAIKPGDTIDTITARAAPYASQQELLDIQKTKSEIQLNNAQAQKALNGDGGPVTDPNVISIIAQAANTNPAVLGTIKDPTTASLVVNAIAAMNKPRDYSESEITSLVQTGIGQGQGANQIKASIAADPKITNKDAAYAIVGKLIPSTPPATLKGAATSVVGGATNLLGDIVDFFGGNTPNRIVDGKLVKKQ